MERGGDGVIKKMCDICGKGAYDLCTANPCITRETPKINLNIVKYDTFSGYKNISYDFCPECSKYMYDKIKTAMQERKEVIDEC